MKSPGFSLFFVKYSLILEKAADGAACWCLCVFGSILMLQRGRDNLSCMLPLELCREKGG